MPGMGDRRKMSFCGGIWLPGLDSPIKGIGVNSLARSRLTDFEGKIQVLSLVSLTAQGGLPNLPQLSVIREADKGITQLEPPRHGWGTMLAWRATCCQRPCCFIQTAVMRRCSVFPALGIFPPHVTVSLPATITVSP